MVLAGRGIFNAVTVTQASAVWELKAAAPHLLARELVTGGRRNEITLPRVLVVLDDRIPVVDDEARFCADCGSTWMPGRTTGTAMTGAEALTIGTSTLWDKYERPASAITSVERFVERTDVG
jgi:hypothetical protein